MVNPGTDARPIRRGGFEEAWSSSGLVLVDLESDVLHHLNAPAAVVLELVGDRSFAEIVEAYAALSDGDRGTASDAVRVALDGLAEIGAIDGWALS